MNTIENALADLQKICNNLSECKDQAQWIEAILLTLLIQNVISTQKIGACKLVIDATLPILKAENAKKIKPLKS